ncbi:hypothetical protein [Paenibacillus sp. Leaf72]|uniref:hypothetical protein n=1 Tax=Paenibacillus sp. Leaf72 TaxID=1736234 RepID=UPI0006F9F924|nr:hypothetical protein [Paenibacillus sp. Leaf72]KQN96970.1 hypothetical protein ASF12_23160 [Paenibacillus sp. Leaf72]
MKEHLRNLVDVAIKRDLIPTIFIVDSIFTIDIYLIFSVDLNEENSFVFHRFKDEIFLYHGFNLDFGFSANNNEKLKLGPWYSRKHEDKINRRIIKALNRHVKKLERKNVIDESSEVILDICVIIDPLSLLENKPHPLFKFSELAKIEIDLED